MRYAMVPKGARENLLFRQKLLRACVEDAGLAASVKALCARDILFWINTFLWTFDPRLVEAGQNPNVPFLTYPFQDQAILTIVKYLGLRDIGIEKSRDVGASWACLLAFLHEWQFLPSRAFMLVSRNERLVDGGTDSDSLFWKLDYLIDCQPKFLLDKEKEVGRTKLHLFHRVTKSNIDGASTTADVGRGGRRTAVLLDEFGAFEVGDSHAANAATQANTNCRVFNSTYKGAVGSFYEQMQREDLVKISLHWSLHPRMAEGIYYDAAGKPRSPWYDQACKRLIVPGLIAQELDMDPQGAASMFYPAELLDRLIGETVRNPVKRGRYAFKESDPKDGEWLDDGKGMVLLWMHLVDGRVPKSDKYVMGADISAGTGATNSVLTVADLRTREKVAEFATATLSPDRFADAVAALGWFFNEAFLIFESNGGVGQGFSRRLVHQGYTNLYLKRDEKGLRKELSSGLIPGWHSTADEKMALHGEYVRALANGSFVNRSRDALQECRQYVYLATGGIGNARATAILDPSGSRENHGDRPTADALCNKALGAEHDAVQLRREQDPFSLEGEAEYGGWKWRRQKAMRESRNEEMRSWEGDLTAELAGW